MLQERTDRIADASHAVWHKTLRKRIYEIIETGHGEDPASKIFDSFIVVLILLNVAAFVAETVPSLEAAWRPWFHWFEVFSVAIFTIEYGLRLWTATEVPYLNRKHPWKARLNLACHPALIIDLLAFLPFYLSAIVLIDLRILRTLRLLRFLKLSRYSPAMYTLIRVLSNERKALAGAGLLLAMALLFSATLMYYIEGNAQPDKFGTIPEAAWWSIATLTTVGYGDVTPITALGKLIGSVTMVMGLCILALPVAIISTGFAQELQRRDFVISWSLMSRVPLLARLDAKEASEIMPLLEAHNLPPNVEVVKKGSPGDAMYFIASGRLEKLEDGQRRVYSVGDVFGVETMFENSAHGEAIITSSRCRLLKLQREDFHRLASKQPRVASHIRRLATGDLREAS